MTVSHDYLIESKRVLYRLTLIKDEMCPVTLHHGNNMSDCLYDALSPVFIVMHLLFLVF